jgi:hypothetical protein
MTYTNRTCSQCGIRKPQPDMYSKEVYTETGNSKTGVSGATWIGFVLGDKKSTKSVGSWFFNSGQRTYRRKKTVWVCGPCGGYGISNRKRGGFWRGFGKFILWMLFLSIVLDVYKAVM